MLTFLKRKPAPKPELEIKPEVPLAPKAKPLATKMAEGHAAWNLVLEEELRRCLDGLGIPLSYEPNSSKAPSQSECDRYGYE